MKSTRVFYGWVVVAVAFICLAVGYAVWHSFSIFYVAILAEFGWTRAGTALAFSTFTIAYGISSPLSGALADRFGARIVIPIGAFILAGGLFASSMVSEPWHLYVFYGIITATGLNMIGTIVNFTVLANWFSRRRGTAIGIAAAGIGVGMLLLVPLLQYVINLAGWRTAYLVMGIIVLVVVPGLALLFHRQRPEDMGLLPDGGPAALRKTASGPPPQIKIVNEAWARRAWTVRGALGTRTFWLLFAGYACGTLSHQSVMVHQVAYLTDRRFDPMLGASVVGLVGIFGSVGKVFWGWASDHIGREYAYGLGMAGMAAGIVVLSQVVDASQVMGVYLYTLVFGIGYGVFSPMTSSISADLFQGKRFGSIYGVLYVGSSIGSAVGPWVSGMVFDATRSYQAALAMAACAALLSAVAIWLAAPRKVRLVPGMAARAAKGRRPSPVEQNP